MQRNRTILWALLIPLLLDLMVFFAVAPSSEKTSQPRIEEGIEEICEELLEIEELEEEVEFLYAGLPDARQLVDPVSFGFSKRIFHTPSAMASLASGWSMPLRI